MKKCIRMLHDWLVLNSKVRQLIVAAVLLLNTTAAQAVNLNANVDNKTYYAPIMANFIDGESATGLVVFPAGFDISDNARVAFNVPVLVQGAVSLGIDSVLTFTGDHFWGSNSYISIGSGNNDKATIDGGSHTLFIGGDISIPANRTLIIGGGNLWGLDFHDLAIDGQGYTFSFAGQNSAIVINNDRVLTLRNMVIEGLCGLKNIQGPGTLKLQNVDIKLGSDATWTVSCPMIIEDMVSMSGNRSTFGFLSSSNLTVNPNSMLLIDHGMTFTYGPKDGSRTRLVLSDGTSHLYLNDCTFCAPVRGGKAGVLLTRGTLLLDNKITLSNESNTDWSKSIELGDGNNDNNDLTIKVLAGARVDIDGLVYHHPNMVS